METIHLSTARRQAQFVPPKASSIEDTGLDLGFIADLALKVIYFNGSILGGDIAARMRLPFFNIVEQALNFLKTQRFIEVSGGTGYLGTNYQYVMSERGHTKVQELFDHSQYYGPCPVTLDDYWFAASQQSIRKVVVTKEMIQQAFSHMVLPRKIMDQLGPAINSGRSIFLFGAPGNGKTTIAEAAATCLGGDVFIPHAVIAEGQIIKIYDEIHHREREGASYDNVDDRWVIAHRPVVTVGGELTLADLELTFSSSARTYEAPLQVKANGGLLLIDDFGRQQMAPAQLLNRWIVPLEKRVDYLALQTGNKLKVPFDALIVFSTNLEPRQLVDDAFLRRIRYKVQVTSPDRETYREIFRRACEAKNIDYHDQALAYILTYWYEKHGIEPRAVHPRDIVDQLLDIAHYMEVRPALTRELLDLACESYFVKI